MKLFVVLALCGLFAFGPIGNLASAAPDVIWQFATEGQIWSSASEAQGTLYFGSDDGHLYALETNTGRQRWRFKTEGLVRCKPAVFAESVVFASDDGLLYCLDRTTGSEHWRFDLESAELERGLPSPSPPFYYDYLQSSPLVVDGTVFVGSASGYVYAVNAQTGIEVWRFQTGDLVRSSPQLNGATIVVGSWDKHVYCLDRQTGQPVWQMDTGGVVQASPAVSAGRVFIGSRNPVMLALAADTGEQLWQHVYEDGSWVESSGVVRDGVVYVGSSDALVLTGFATENGDLMHSFRTGGWSWCTPAVTDRIALIGGISAEPYYMPGITLQRGLWAVDRQTAQARWRFATDRIDGYLTGGVIATPAVVGDVAYFGALDGNMYAVNLGLASFTEERIVVSSAGWDLVGDLLLPESDEPVPGVLLLNQAGGNRAAYDNFARLLADRGIGSLRLDLRGHGESNNLGQFKPGEDASIDFPWESEADVAAGYKYLKSHPAISDDKIGMVGASYSGEEMAQAARADEYCQAYVALSPGSLGDDSINAIDSCDVPWLIVIAEDDRYLKEISQAIQETSEKVELHSILGSRHGTNVLQHHPEVADLLADWLADHLVE